MVAPDGRAKGIAIACDCNSRLVYLDPYEGARAAVFEAASNLVATGARPLATTNCLNFGNPEKPEIMWQFAEAVRGIGSACQAVGAPIVSGNVSLYNETDGKAIFPTPMIAMVGLLENAEDRIVQSFAGPDDAVFLVGAPEGEVGGSEYLDVVHGRIAGRPARVSDEEVTRVFAAMAALAGAGLVRSAHDVSDGGLVSALAECCVSGEAFVGARITLPPGDTARVLFGEAPARFVVTCASKDAAALETVVRDSEARLIRLGTTGGDALSLAGAQGRWTWRVDELAQAWRHGLDAVTA